MLTRHFPNPTRAYFQFILSYLIGFLFRRNIEAAQSPEQVRRILIVNLGHIGDGIMSLGVAQNLRNAFPDAEITAVVGRWSESFVRECGSVNDIIVYSGGIWAKRHRGSGLLKNVSRLFRGLRRPKYDIVVSLHCDLFTLLYGALCGARYRVDFGAYRVARRLSSGTAVPHPANGHIYSDFMCLLEMLGIPAPEALPAMSPGPETEALPVVRNIEEGTAEAPLVLVHPFGAYSEKEWSVERYARLIERLVETQAARIIVSGAPGDEAKVSELAHLCAAPFENLVGQTSFLALGAVMRKSDLVITTDGGPMHLAAAAGVRVIALFGPTDPERWAPLSPEAAVFYRATDCGPCDQATECIRQPRCIDRTSVDEVVAKAAEILADC